MHWLRLLGDRGLSYRWQVESYITRDTTFSRIMQGQALNQHRLIEGNLAAFGYQVRGPTHLWSTLYHAPHTLHPLVLCI